MNFSIEALTDTLIREPDIELAFLFGSRAKGTGNSNSDIDIAVRCHDELSAERKLAIMSSIGATFGLPVDLIDIRKAGEPLLGQILQGTMLVGSKTHRAELIARNLLDHADFGPIRARILKQRRQEWINK